MSATHLIKKEAKLQLSNDNWIKAVLITLVCLLLFSMGRFLQLLFNWIARFNINFNISAVLVQNPVIDGMATHIALLITNIIWLIVVLFIVSPVLYGFTKWTYAVANGESPNVDMVFYYFRNKTLYIRAIKFAVFLKIREIAIFIICILPGLIISICSSLLNYVNYNFRNLILMIGVDMVLLGIIAFIVLINRYFLAPYLLVFDDELATSKCLKYSWRMMKGNIMKVIILNFSFILWLMLCVFIIPVFYVMPYIKVSRAVCAKWIIDLVNKQTQVSI